MTETGCDQSHKVLNVNVKAAIKVKSWQVRPEFSKVFGFLTFYLLFVNVKVLSKAADQ